MNKKLLRQIKKTILAKPEQFRMDSWNCGTAMCIAGHACNLAGLKWTGKRGRKLAAGGDVGDVAAAVLDIDPPSLIDSYDVTEADRLFWVDKWPHDLQDDYLAANTHTARARVAAKRIERFITSVASE